MGFVDEVLAEDTRYTLVVSDIFLSYKRYNVAPSVYLSIGICDFNSLNYYWYKDLTSFEEIDASSILDFAVAADNYYEQAEDVTYTFEFLPTKPISSNGKIVVTFPDDYGNKYDSSIAC